MRPAATDRARPTRPPWLVDRIFRNLLVDVTGNTHRAEFCIDKLYSPDSATGRLGLARVARLRDAAARAHEPGAAAAGARAARLVLARAVRGDADPLGHAAARSLPAAALRRARLRARSSTTCGAPATRSSARGSRRTSSSAFRCTAASSTTAWTIELRQAIEPWYVLGEEPGAGGTARYVDSSVERLQVRVRGLDARALHGHLQRRAAAAAADRHAGRVRLRRALPRLAAAALPASDDSGAHAAGLRRGRPGGPPRRSAAAPTTWRIRAGGTTRPFR